MVSSSGRSRKVPASAPDAGSGRSHPRQPARPRRGRWRRAVRSLRRLLREPQRTESAFEVLFALNGNADERGLRRLRRLPEGRRLLAQRPSLAAALEDRDGLRRLPPGSLGRVYLDFIERNQIEIDELLKVRRKTDPTLTRCDDELLWYIERDELLHDLWHVLTGYGPDPFGEASLLPFSLGQKGGLGRTVLTFGAVVRSLRVAGRVWPGYAYRSWRRGRKAACLAALPWEELLALPLDDVRRIANVEPPWIAHPAGILRGSPSGEKPHVELVPFS